MKVTSVVPGVPDALLDQVAKACYLAWHELTYGDRIDPLSWPDASSEYKAPYLREAAVLLGMSARSEVRS